MGKLKTNSENYGLHTQDTRSMNDYQQSGRGGPNIKFNSPLLS